MSPKLILFDIDGTILHTYGVSKRIFCRALSEVFEVEVRWENYAYQGQPDRKVAQDFLARQGIEVDSNSPLLKRAFERMGELWHDHPVGQDIEVYPGVIPLIERAGSRTYLGQLTANVQPAAVGKLVAAGIDPDVFPTGGYGEDADDRNELLPIALERFRSRFNQPFDPQETVLIGDSPADILCAQYGGARVVAVATGRYDAQSLAPFNPDLLIQDLASGWSTVLDFLRLGD